jgi:cytochrome c oxidase cbb3-type subunit 1
MFLEASIVFFGVGCVWGTIMTFPSVHSFLESAPARIIVGMHSHWNLLGWVSLALIGVIYYLVPAIVGKELYSEKLARIHFWLFVLLIIITSTLGTVAGYQGGMLFSAKRFTEIEATMGPYMIMLNVLYIIEALVPVSLFAYNIRKTITRK